MTSARFDVLGIGNAIIDVLARTEDDFLIKRGLAKGSMQLISEVDSEALYHDMGPATLISGGSAANTIVGVSSFGGKAAFIGKVRNDAAGEAFAHDIRAAGVHFPTPAATEGKTTAKCMILITPDGERTMNTYLGTCQDLGPDDVDAESVKAAQITYLEGYLWDPPAAKQAFIKAADIAHQAGRKVALTLSDSFCVDRYREEFIDLIDRGIVDILFANMHELRSLYTTADLDTAVAALRRNNLLAVVTCSEQGALVVEGHGVQSCPAVPVEQVVDTTGAGDLYAAGFLFGLSQGRAPLDCARLGALAASEIISHIGARPDKNLRDLARAEGLLGH
jgi:sugar/nucleoside kinase (ribokinase family)